VRAACCRQPCPRATDIGAFDGFLRFNFTPDMPLRPMYIINVGTHSFATPFMSAGESEHPSGCPGIIAVALDQPPHPAMEKVASARPGGTAGRRTA